MSRKDRRHDPETAERVTSIIEAAEQAATALLDKADSQAKRYLAEAEAEADRAAATRLQELLETAEALQAQAEAVQREVACLLESVRHAEVSPAARDNGRQPGPATPQPSEAESRDGGPAAGPEDAAAPRAKHLAAVPGPAQAAGQTSWPARGPAQPGAPEGEPPSAYPTAPAPASTQFQSGASGDGPVPEPGDPEGNVPPLTDRSRSDGAAGARLLATQMAVSGYSRREIEAKLREGFRIEDPTAILDAILGPGD